MIREFKCEYCGEVFETEEECTSHEQKCQGLEKKVCMKCGKIHIHNSKRMATEHFTDINLGKNENYGSKLENRVLNMVICDDCLFEYISSFQQVYKESLLQDTIQESFQDYYDCYDSTEYEKSQYSLYGKS